MDVFTAPQLPTEVTRVVYRGWGELASGAASRSSTDAAEFRARLLGDIVLAPAETTYATMRLGLPCWEDEGWSRDVFLPLFMQQTRALSVLQRKVRADLTVSQRGPDDMESWIHIPYASPADATFLVQLVPDTVIFCPGRHGMHTEIDWEDTQRPLSVGDTVAVEAVVRCGVLTIEAEEIQIIFPDACPL